jgi:hypothetical protein
MCVEPGETLISASHYQHILRGWGAETKESLILLKIIKTLRFMSVIPIKICCIRNI